MKIYGLLYIACISAGSAASAAEEIVPSKGNQAVVIHGSNYAPITLTINDKKNAREALTFKSLLLEVEVYAYYDHPKSEPPPSEVVGVIQTQIRDRKGQPLFETRVTETDKASIRWNSQVIGHFSKDDPLGDIYHIVRTRGAPLVRTTYSLVRSDCFVRKDGLPMTLRDLLPIQTIWLSIGRDTDFKKSPARQKLPTLPQKSDVSARTRIRMFGERTDGGWLPICDTEYGDFLKPYVAEVGTLPVVDYSKPTSEWEFSDFHHIKSFVSLLPDN